LRVDVVRKGLAAVLSVRGSLHEGNIRALNQAVRSARQARVVLIVLDLGYADAIDAAGVRAVLETQANGREDGWDLVVIPPSEDVATGPFADQELRRQLCLLDREDASYLIEFYAKGPLHRSESWPWQ
jgi:anti-anti-sigma regulatory factor